MDTGLTATVPPPKFDHLLGLTDRSGAFEHETADRRLSPTLIAGRGPEDARPAFDQQPVQVSALADACARALVDNDPMCTDGCGPRWPGSSAPMTPRSPCGSRHRGRRRGARGRRREQ